MSDRLIVKIRRFISHPTLHRWIDLTFLTLVSVLLMEMLRPEIRALAKAFLNRSRSWSGGITFLFLTLLSWISSLVLVRLGALNIGHFSVRRLIGFPPVWISAAASTLWLLAIPDKGFYDAFRIPAIMIVPWMLWWLAPFALGVLITFISEHGSSLLNEAPDEGNELDDNSPETTLIVASRRKADPVAIGRPI